MIKPKNLETMPLILPKTGLYEFEEKRSKFIGFCSPVSNEHEARSIIADVRSLHPKANHNVYAYSVNNTPRFNDDGEPSGTGGMPILNVFEKTGVIDYICVVTRYFGGTLLGFGGLVRAYTKAAKGAMDNAGPCELVITKIFKVTCDYSKFDKTKYNLDKWGIEILNVSYTEACAITVSVKVPQLENFLQELGYGYLVEELK